MTDFLLPCTENQILKSLPAAEYSKLHPHLEAVKFKRGEIIYQAGAPANYVYFPQTCAVDLMTIFGNGAGIESGIVGAEGMLGANSALLQLNNNREAQVLTDGQCLRMKAGTFRTLFLQNSTLHSLIQKYLCVFNEQVAQLGACNSQHPLRARIARALLLHSLNNKIPMTQEAISQLLGAHRPSVSLISSQFKAKGLIYYLRGALQIIDRQGLEAEACECYKSIRENYLAYYAELKAPPAELGTARIPRLAASRLKASRNFSLAD